MNENKTPQGGASARAVLQCEMSPLHRIPLFGYTVKAVENESIDWNALQLESYDFLITDHNLIKISGTEVLKKIHAACLELPVIMRLGATLPEELNRDPQLIIEAALLKPYAVAEFLEVVKKVLGGAAVARNMIAPTQTGKAGRQQLVCSHDDDPTPQFDVRLTIV